MTKLRIQNYKANKEVLICAFCYSNRKRNHIYNYCKGKLIFVKGKHFLRIHFPFGFQRIVLYGPVPSSRSGLHFLSNTVALAGITGQSQGTA